LTRAKYKKAVPAAPCPDTKDRCRFEVRQVAPDATDASDVEELVAAVAVAVTVFVAVVEVEAGAVELWGGLEEVELEPPQPTRPRVLRSTPINRIATRALTPGHGSESASRQREAGDQSPR
jgi:hypothetical protein